MLLSDVEGNPPVHVETRDESYSDSLIDDIDSLEPGNLIKAEIRSESVAQRDGLWFFLTLEIIESTRFHFIDGADTHPTLVDEMKDALEDVNSNSARKSLSSDGERIGYLTVAEGQGGDLWKGLQVGTNSHEIDLNNLSNIGDAPHEIVYTRSPDSEYLIFYHFSEKGTDLCERILDNNL
ncbi:hypothetical protein [Salinarchaeum sp. Harcht-Bsk1]|uniref:hypothetical protein n=1 Tax=Salinarchaeum sp. Harcht-Bsk1 TaxID=1333523 RepID=UPI00118193A4|nr:hypothetical protein [Salinarchaeum sp. Harcht-Bsk1]